MLQRTTEGWTSSGRSCHGHHIFLPFAVRNAAAAAYVMWMSYCWRLKEDKEEEGGGWYFFPFCTCFKDTVHWSFRSITQLLTKIIQTLDNDNATQHFWIIWFADKKPKKNLQRNFGRLSSVSSPTATAATWEANTKTRLLSYITPWWIWWATLNWFVSVGF